jgi:hypothetical protein
MRGETEIQDHVVQDEREQKSLQKGRGDVSVLEAESGEDLVRCRRKGSAMLLLWPAGVHCRPLLPHDQLRLALGRHLGAPVAEPQAELG